jgi:hypothetical protein
MQGGILRFWAGILTSFTTGTAGQKCGKKTDSREFPAVCLPQFILPEN